MLYHLFFGRVPKPRAAKERGRAAGFTVRFCLHLATWPSAAIAGTALLSPQKGASPGGS